MAMPQVEPLLLDLWSIVESGIIVQSNAMAPEPGTLAMVGLGLTIFGVARLHRRTQDEN